MGKKEEKLDVKVKTEAWAEKTPAYNTGKYRRGLSSPARLALSSTEPAEFERLQANQDTLWRRASNYLQSIIGSESLTVKSPFAAIAL